MTFIAAFQSGNGAQAYEEFVEAMARRIWVKQELEKPSLALQKNLLQTLVFHCQSVLNLLSGYLILLLQIILLEPLVQPLHSGNSQRVRLGHFVNS